MAITKEQALEHMAEVYEYCLSTNNLGFNHTMSRELFVWMQRHWASAGVERAQVIRRKVTAEKKEEKKTVAPGTTEAQAKGLTTFKPLQSGAPRFKAPLKAMDPPKVSRIETAQEAEHPAPQPQSPPTEKKEKVAVTELTADELAALVQSKPRAILSQYGEPRISLTLQTVFNVSEEDMPSSGSQKAALLKQKVIEAGKK